MALGDGIVVRKEVSAPGDTEPCFLCGAYEGQHFEVEHVDHWTNRTRGAATIICEHCIRVLAQALVDRKHL